MIRGDRHITIVADDPVRFHVCQSPLTWSVLRIYVGVTIVTALSLPMVIPWLESPRMLIFVPALFVAGAGYLIARQTGEVLVDHDLGILISRTRRWAFLESTKSLHKTRLTGVILSEGPRSSRNIDIVLEDGSRCSLGLSVGCELGRRIADRVAGSLGLPLSQGAAADLRKGSGT